MIATTTHAPRIVDIQRTVARHFAISIDDLKSRKRAKWIVDPRHLAMFLARRMTSRSQAEIGRHFGGCDPSTVFHAMVKVADRLARDEAFAALECDLRKSIEHSCRCRACIAQVELFPADPPQLLLPIAWPGELVLEHRIAA